jgi:predicted lipoprotein
MSFPLSAPATNSTSRSRRPWPLVVVAILAVALFVVFPPFRVGSKKTVADAAANASAAAFDPLAFVEKFWTEQLQPAADRAPDAAPVLADLRRDPAAALHTHAHRVGIGNAAYYFVRGTGRVTAVERSRLLVEIDGSTVAVRTGPVFGNAIRDGCGLLDVNQVPGLAEFNALSAELNRLVEERVQPALKSGIKVGATLIFAGCAEAPESLSATGPMLTFIPVRAEVAP